MVQDFSKLPSESDSMAKENNDIALWFLNDYFTGATGDKGATKHTNIVLVFVLR